MWSIPNISVIIVERCYHKLSTWSVFMCFFFTILGTSQLPLFFFHSSKFTFQRGPGRYSSTTFVCVIAARRFIFNCKFQPRRGKCGERNNHFVQVFNVPSGKLLKIFYWKLTFYFHPETKRICRNVTFGVDPRCSVAECINNPLTFSSSKSTSNIDIYIYIFFCISDLKCSIMFANILLQHSEFPNL